jgi:hypothetical protein
MVCNIWFLTLRGNHRLRLIKNRMLRKIFGPKRQEVTASRRKYHELKNLLILKGPVIEVTSF